MFGTVHHVHILSCPTARHCCGVMRDFHQAIRIATRAMHYVVAVKDQGRDSETARALERALIEQVEAETMQQ